MLDELEKFGGRESKVGGNLQTCRTIWARKEIWECQYVFNEHPLLSNKLSSPSFENLGNPKWTSILPIKRKSTWTISPRMLIPAVTCMGKRRSRVRKLMGIASWLARNREEGKMVYVHAPTGLEHHLRPTGKGIPVLQYWEPMDFKNHLKQADDARIEDVLIWLLVENCELNGDTSSKSWEAITGECTLQPVKESFCSYWEWLYMILLLPSWIKLWRGSRRKVHYSLILMLGIDAILC